MKSCPNSSLCKFEWKIHNNQAATYVKRIGWQMVVNKTTKKGDRERDSDTTRNVSYFHQKNPHDTPHKTHTTARHAQDTQHAEDASHEMYHIFIKKIRATHHTQHTPPHDTHNNVERGVRARIDIPVVGVLVNSLSNLSC